MSAFVDTLPAGEAQQARLRQFLGVAGLTALGFGALLLGVAALGASAAALVVGVALVASGAATLLTWRYAAGGSTVVAVASEGVNILLLALVCAAALPAVLPVLITFPLVVSALALTYLRRRMILLISGWSLAVSLALALIAQLPPLLPAPPPQVISLLVVTGAPAASALVLLLLWQSSHVLAGMLSQTRAANTRLVAAQEGLETQVAERTGALAQALAEVEARAADQARLLDENAQQRAALHALSVPILPLSSGVLVMPLVGALDLARMQQAQKRALDGIAECAARYLILDITGVPVVDDAVAQGLIQIVQAAQLLGTRVVLAGIRPEVAQSLVGLGVALGGITTRATLESAVAETLART